MTDGLDEWLEQCMKALAEAERCTERLGRAGRGDGLVTLRNRITRLRAVFDRARGEQAVVPHLREGDPNRMNSDR